MESFYVVNIVLSDPEQRSNTGSLLYEAVSLLFLLGFSVKRLVEISVDIRFWGSLREEKLWTMMKLWCYSLACSLEVNLF